VIEIEAVIDEGLGHSSYVVGLGDGTALVVDPARFPERQRRLAAERGWDITWTADTHSHADYLSGSPELAADGATFLASRGAGLEPEHRGLDHGERVGLAPDVELRAIATPGHTPDHLALLLVVGDEPQALFSGGSLMVGALGRPDLLGEEHRDELARALHRAVRAEILTLPDDLDVYPTHGAGSFCSAPQGSARTTTIGIERRSNPMLGIEDEDDFVAALIEGLGSFPTYFRQLPEINRRGPRVLAAPPPLARLDVDRVRVALEEGATLVDARPIASFGEAHATGSLSIEQRGVFASWLGWLVPLGHPIVFLLGDDNDRTDLVRQCFTVGHEHLLGEVGGGIDAWRAADLPVSSIPLVDASEVRGTILDVRQEAEWRRGHVAGSVHLELGLVGTVPAPAGPLTVLCGHGERAMTGASILAAAGHGDVRVLRGGPDDLLRLRGEALERS
jgi:hydroxyacylglutathione hydrolase